MVVIVYFGIAGGFVSATGKFWSSIFWPSIVGEMLAQEAKKRGMLS